VLMLLIASMILLHGCIAIRYYKRGWHTIATFNAACISFLLYLVWVKA